MDVSAKPGRMSARYSRTRIFSRRQLSTTDRIAATFGPACWLPTWIQFFRLSKQGSPQECVEVLIGGDLKASSSAGLLGVVAPRPRESTTPPTAGQNGSGESKGTCLSRTGKNDQNRAIIDTMGVGAIRLRRAATGWYPPQTRRRLASVPGPPSLPPCGHARRKAKAGTDEAISNDDVDQSRTLPRACEQARRLTFQAAELERVPTAQAWKHHEINDFTNSRGEPEIFR
jgi:hypothetical protein